jgi:multiple sugar transport system ATP-binding protein
MVEEVVPMAEVAFHGVRKRYRGATSDVLQAVDLTIPDGCFAVLVGPSGCGKTTLLRLIAGLEEASGGEIRIGDQVVNNVPPARRGVAMVFQSYALYPHMTVEQNMAFGLRCQKMPRDEIARRIQQVAQQLEMAHLLERKPRQLSGGQRQRVAIGRALVKEPRVFLFDEPLSNLDAALRVRMRLELGRLHKRLKSTMVYVTHDQVEAMTLSELMVVLNEGRIQQADTPLQLYHHPANRFVAGFVGSPQMNFLSGELLSAEVDQARVALGTGEIIRCAVDARACSPGEQVAVGVRPEHISLESRAQENVLHAELLLKEPLGESVLLHWAHGASTEPLTVRIADNLPLHLGERYALYFPDFEVHLFNAAGQALPRIVFQKSMGTSRIA